MKKITFITIFALATLPVSGCNSGGDQAAYMQSPKAEQNAREAELAEEEFAQLAKHEVKGEPVKTKKGEKKKVTKAEKTSAKSATKTASNHETKQEQAIREQGEKIAKSRHTDGTGVAPGEETAAHVTLAKHEAPKHETPKQEAATNHETREPASTPAKHMAATAGDKVWTVNLGAFKVKENAERLTAKLKTAGFPVMMRQMNHSKNGELFVVHLEPTPNKSEAQKWQTDLKLKSIDSVLSQKKD